MSTHASVKSIMIVLVDQCCAAYKFLSYNKKYACVCCCVADDVRGSDDDDDLRSGPEEINKMMRKAIKKNLGYRSGERRSLPAG